MDHDDDASGGLDDLSRLFGTGTAPVPATPSTAPPPVAPTDAGDASPSATGQPAVAPSFGAPVPATPASGVAAAPAAAPPAGAAPYSPPPLVPAEPLSSAPPLAPPPTSPVPPSPPQAEPAHEGDAVIAPAFGGLPVAGRREPPPRTDAAPAAAAAPEPAAPPVRTSPPVPKPEPVGMAAATSSVTTEPAAPPRPPPAPPAQAAAPPTPYTGNGPLLSGGAVDDIADDAQIARPTLAEKIFFVLTILLPPVGLVGTAVAAVGSSRRRGWVIGLLRAGLAIGVVMSVLSAGGAYAGYKAIRQQQAHAQTVAASTAFCAAFAKDKTLGTVDGGWPQPGASVPDSLTAMQAYVDRWNALAKISPAGVQPGVASVAAAGTELIKTVQVQRTVDDAQNRPLLVSAVGSAGIADWRANYCE